MNVDLQRALNAAWEKVVGWVEGFIASLPNLVAAFIVLLLFILAGRIARRIISRLLARVSRYPDVNRVLSGAVFGAVVLGGVFVALGILELDKTVTSLLAGAGIAGLALSLAFQGTAENYIAGIMLNIRREMTDGDIIESNDHMGVVERVEMRATRLRTFDGRLVIIPNSEVYKTPLVNYSDRRTRRVDIPVGVSYGDDLEKVRRVALDAVHGVAGRDEARDVELFYSGFGDSSIDFVVRFWIPFHAQTDYLRARSDAVMRIKAAFDREDVTIPFPIRTLDFSPVGGVELGRALPPQSGAEP